MVISRDSTPILRLSPAHAFQSPAHRARRVGSELDLTGRGYVFVVGVRAVSIAVAQDLYKRGLRR